ncbi:c-type cytochrome [Celeribacter sp.]|uniref:c-type cytochrome n=1 Tax=Celeribacter sp. TaxID=1890673 RepID=UPI003A939D12
MKITLVAATLSLGLAVGAVAHDHVSNPAVAARMEAMSAIGASIKTLGSMAKGEIEFDADAAQAAVDTVAVESTKVPALFEAQETDPESEAKPEIWSNWDDFVAKAQALQTAAEGATISTAADIGPAMGAMGGTCKACHSDYRL